MLRGAELAVVRPRTTVPARPLPASDETLAAAFPVLWERAGAELRCCQEAYVLSCLRKMPAALAVDLTEVESQRLQHSCRDVPAFRREARRSVRAVELALHQLLVPLEGRVASEAVRVEVDLTRRMLNGVLGSATVADLRRRLVAPSLPLQVCHGDATVVQPTAHPRAGFSGDGCGIVYPGHTRRSGWTRCERRTGS